MATTATTTGTSASGTRRCCELAAVSFSFRGGSQLFIDHQGQIGKQRHLFPVPEAQLLVHNLRLIYGQQAQADLA